jgi:cytoskeleton protein RodZ
MTNKTGISTSQQDTEPTISLGNYLQSERQKKNLSIQEIAAATKVPPEALTAIESGDKKQLPVPVFAKGFVKIYSGYLGLDQNDILKRFQKEWDNNPSADTPEMLHEESMAQISPYYLSLQFYVILIGIGLLLGLAYFFFNANVSPENQDLSLNTIRDMKTLPTAIIPKEKHISVSKINAPEFQPHQVLISPKSAGKIAREEDSSDIILATLPSVIIVRKKTDTPASAKQETAAETRPGDKSEFPLPDHAAIQDTERKTSAENEPSSPTLPLDLHIAFLARTSISISQDEASPLKYIFSPGEESSWSADKTISMQVEKAENIRITLNGKIIPLPKSQDKPLAITLPADLHNL